MRLHESVHAHTRTRAHTQRPTNKPKYEQLKNFVACSSLVEMKQEGSEFLIALKVNLMQRNVFSYKNVFSHRTWSHVQMCALGFILMILLFVSDNLT